ncbi:integrase catalytic domain-containing protein [Trichonephila clavipes]|nr:integrase catalytic domain-containing protein [Trichonephila clavipes]
MPIQIFPRIICALYDYLKQQIRALETLGVTTDKYACLLYPLVESCMQQDLLKVFQQETEGRYKVSLSWKENPLPIPSNKVIAMKQLESSTKKLHQETLFTAYDDVFKEWELLGIIENDPVDSSSHLHGHYLPHI